jgi:hypothetical protein
MGARLVCQYCGHVHDAKKNKKILSNQQMSEVRQKLIVGIFSSVFIDKSKYWKKSVQPFFCLIEGSPHPPPQTRSKNDGSEPVLLNVYGAPELMPRNEFRQPM